jgi:hypothetical protein
MGAVPLHPSATRFADACATLVRAARGSELEPPSFRSPPGIADAVRTVRRRPDGGAVVSVRHRGRPFMAVLADLVEGVVVANRLTGKEAMRARSALWEAVAALAQEEAAA